MRRGRWDEAQRGFEASLALKQAVLADHPGDIEAQDAIASARTWLGQVAHLTGQSANALALYDAARAVQLQLFKRHPGESVRLRDLGVIESRRAEALQALGRRDEVVQARQSAVNWMKQALVNGASNAFWQAESLLADSALLLAQADAGLVIDGGAKLLQQRLASQANGAGNTVREWRQSKVLADLIAAEQAAQARNWPAARGMASAVAHEVQDLMTQYPYLWQGRELQARAGLLLLRADAGANDGRYSAQLCAANRTALQPAIDSGQAGFVLEAWLMARACANQGAIAATDVQTLTMGGYRPRSTEFSTQFNVGQYHDNNDISTKPRIGAP